MRSDDCEKKRKKTSVKLVSKDYRMENNTKIMSARSSTEL